MQYPIRTYKGLYFKYITDHEDKRKIGKLQCECGLYFAEHQLIRHLKKPYHLKNIASKSSIPTNHLLEGMGILTGSGTESRLE
jgi:hypothetical protein